MRLLFAILLTLTAPRLAAADDLAPALTQLRHDWAAVYYQTPKDLQLAQFAGLEARADALAAQHPADAAPLILKAIILSTHAEAKGGLGALSLAEAARDTALQAAKRDDRAVDAGAYTLLGTLYYKVPGWPVGFGNNKKAKAYLDQALAIAPDSIDVNYFIGDFLLEQGEAEEAKVFLLKALQAPPRAGREDEDAGRRREIENHLAQITR